MSIEYQQYLHCQNRTHPEVESQNHLSVIAQGQECFKAQLRVISVLSNGGTNKSDHLDRLSLVKLIVEGSSLDRFVVLLTNECFNSNFFVTAEGTRKSEIIIIANKGETP